MQIVILAGGFGTRLAEETDIKPKPMVEVGGRPLLWHIMKIYASFGHREFFICLGYKGEVIKRYFADYYALNNNLTVHLAKGKVEVKGEVAEDWVVNLVDTGPESNTGGRVKRLKPHLADETFMVTYGDGVADVDINALLDFHRAHGKLATVTAVRPPARFGGMIFKGDRVASFTEKPQIGEGWINGGFFVFEPGIHDYLEGDGTSLEADGLEKLAADGQLYAYKHEGFWQCADTLRDVRFLRGLWDSKKAPWACWDAD